MHFFRLNFLCLFVIFLLTSCGGAKQSPGNITSNSLFVSQKKGSDILGVGSQEAPYKTISHALSKAKENIIIYIAGGNYTSLNDEVFPLILDKGISFIKSDENIDNVFISGAGSDENGKLATIILTGNNVLNSLVLDSNENIAVLSKNGDNEILTSNIKNNKVAIGVNNDSRVTVINTLIKSNSHAGIEASDNSIINLVNSKINTNERGIILSDNSSLEFESNQSSQNNEIMGNTSCDFFHEGKKDLQLKEIKWDDDVFAFNIATDCINGNNIVNIGSATISYQPIPSNNTIFVTNKAINIISPSFGNTIFSTTPDFIYSANENKNVMVALWNTQPSVRDNIIINPKDIVWYWHTGMNNSPIGYVEFNNGRTPIEGNINPSTMSPEAPIPLERGRSYYFAIWEWDDSGANITGSSKISYFIVSP